MGVFYDVKACTSCGEHHVSEGGRVWVTVQWVRVNAMLKIKHWQTEDGCSINLVFALSSANLSLVSSNPLVSLNNFHKTKPFFFQWAIPFTLADIFPLFLTHGSEYLKQKLFQEIISSLIPFLESVQFHPSYGELEACAKLSSFMGPWYFNLVNTAAETTLLCVFMDKRHCNCISSRPANELFNHLHMDVL